MTTRTLVVAESAGYDSLVRFHKIPDDSRGFYRGIAIPDFCLLATTAHEKHIRPPPLLDHISLHSAIDGGVRRQELVTLCFSLSHTPVALALSLALMTNRTLVVAESARYMATVGPYGGGGSYERGTPVGYSEAAGYDSLMRFQNIHRGTSFMRNTHPHRITMGP